MKMNFNMMKSGWIIVFISGFCILAVNAQTHPDEHPHAVSFTYDALPGKIMEHNPELRAALWTIQEAASRLTQSGRLKNPNLITSFNNNQQTPERSTGLGFQQSFPITSRLRLEKNISRLKVNEARAEVMMVAQSIVESALQTATQWFGNQERQFIIADQIQLAKELATFLSSQSAKGEISSLDAEQANLEAGELALGLRPLSLKRKQLESELRISLGLKPATAIHIEGKLPEAKIPSAESILMESRPDYLLLKNQVQTTRESIQLTRANRISDINLQLMHQWIREEDMPIGIEKENRALIQLSIPLPLWNRNQGRIAELNNKLERLMGSIRALEITISNHADAAFTGMIDQLAIYKQIKNQTLPIRVKYQQSLEGAYNEGLSSFERLIQARNQILKLKLKASESLTSFHVHRIQYQSETGNLPISYDSFPIQTIN
ncbi:MAG: TolC family protein [Verrucomicrobia bacterium]|nr:TolC family protein [Verrucomicrobiota bacterium]MBT4274375.1 TolC family protein [Verrucomicrobiota bacterium]MBT6804808.1 TolC family protein [Verrucomicrobiota bacterium]MBT7874299.1 TolC family protein [Verrucomicrobiota bacterium]